MKTSSADSAYRDIDPVVCVPVFHARGEEHEAVVEQRAAALVDLVHPPDEIRRLLGEPLGDHVVLHDLLGVVAVV